MDDKVNILLVDDEPGKLLSYETILGSLGENLITANSGHRALELILHTEIAVILIDVVMPGMDGFELATLIRQHPRFQKTSIIFVSAVQIADLDQLRGYECGAVDYFPVPVVPDLLRARVAVFVDLYRKTRELESLNLRLEQRVAERTRELEAAAARLQEADRRKDEFLAMLAHELRNPLAPVRSAVEILKQLGPMEPRLERAREIIDRQVGQQARLLDDLLDVSRITRGKIQLRPEPLELVSLVRETIEDRRPMLDAAGLTLDLALPEEPIWVEGDSARLAQVVSNLLHNAIKFSDRGGQVAVRLTVAEAGDGPLCAVITVRDTGVGIEPQMLPQLFEAFSQADRSLDRSHGGLGLGLSLVKGLVELHGGQATAHSEGPGRGSEFTIRLPICSGDAEIPATAMRSSSPDRPRLSSAHPLRVLIVEDHLDGAETLRQLLELCHCSVVVAHTGPAGVAAAQQFHPELVLCDLGLPGMNGYEVAAALRREPRFTKTCLVAVSGYGQEEDRRRSLEAGFDMHLIKPVDFEELQRLLRAAPTLPDESESDAVALPADPVPDSEGGTSARVLAPHVARAGGHGSR
jgi:signal transduction histidine kinase